jgi:dimethyl sulfoxide reductase iron-sulfur subunit
MDAKKNRQQSQVSRRSLLGFASIAGVAGIAASLMPELEKKLNAASSTSEQPKSGWPRQWVLIIDLRKCEGCVTQNTPPACVEACNADHFVPEGQTWLKLYRVGETHGYGYFMPVPCMNCENAPCVNICPVGASYHNDEGIVLIDHDRCIGCRMCMAACPYGARSFNWEQPENPVGATFANYSPEFPLPHRVGTVNKCMLCAHRVADGNLPVCAKACPMFALYLGDLVEDVATNGQEVVKLSRFLAENNAFRLKEQLGTRPRVWYIHGHGEEYGHEIDDPREALQARSWQEQETTAVAREAHDEAR